MRCLLGRTVAFAGSRDCGAIVMRSACVRGILYFGVPGVTLMAPYLVGLVFRSRHTAVRVGYDSIMSIVPYPLGVVGLFLFT